jgi:outer membrane lipoprotein carrier protein
MRAFLSLLTLLVGTSAQAAAPSPSPRPSAAPSAKPGPAPKVKKASAELPPLLKEVEAHYGKSPTLAAAFNQVSHTATGNTKKSAGIVEFKRPNKFRWQVTQPDPSISVSNGVKAWHYTPPFDEEDHGQVIIKRASEVQTKLANALLSGSFSTIRDMKITPAGANSFTLVPKRGSAGTVRKARIEVNPETKFIWKVTLDHAGGNRAEITLSNIQLGKPLADDLFNFKVPPNTDQAEP